jgi:hypothetical protein
VRFAGRPAELMAATGEMRLERAVASVMRARKAILSEAA